MGAISNFSEPQGEDTPERWSYVSVAVMKYSDLKYPGEEMANSSLHFCY